MQVVSVHRLSDDEGRRVSLGEHRFDELPRIGDSVAIDNDGENEVLKIVDVIHVARFESNIKRAAYGYPEPTIHLYGNAIEAAYGNLDPIVLNK